jgi:transmembrane sensor
MTPSLSTGIADNSSNTLVPRDELALRKEVVAWYARLCSGESNEADQQALQDWLQQHPDHRRAWERMQSIRQSMQAVPANIALPTLQSVRRGRRAVLRGVFLLASTGGLAYVSYRASTDRILLQPWMADYRTGVGEQRSVLLSDGSRMVLNTDSSADVRYSETRRTVRLWSGEILIETAKHRHAAEDARPFVVQTAQGSILALGTRFTVRTFDDRTVVAVLDDAVELRTLNHGLVRVLQAGQSAVLMRNEISATFATDDALVEWEQGSLVVNDWRLGDVVAELSRYRRGRLACDPAVAEIRVSGAFPLADTDKALQVLVKSFPIRMTSTTRYWVVLGPI